MKINKVDCVVCFPGPKCSKPLCPIGGKNGKEICSGNGDPFMLNAKTCTCKCKPGWLAPDCKKSPCPKSKAGQPCGAPKQGKVTVNKNGKCVCKCKGPMWFGKACDDTKCPLINGKPCGGPSLGNAKVDADGACTCEPKCPGVTVDGAYKVCSGNGRKKVNADGTKCTCECYAG